MFHVEMQEKYQDTVKIKGFESKVIAILMDYIYEEKIFINRDYAVQIWAAANICNYVTSKFCIGFLQDGLTVNNWLDALNAYELHDPAFEAIFHHENL